MKDFLKKAFPFLTVAASAVPGGNLAMSALGQILKLGDGASLDDAGVALMNATPEQRLALKSEEDATALKLKELNINSAEEFERIAAGDRDSARKREMTVKDRIPAILALTVTVGFFASLFYVFHYGVKPESRDMANIVLGALCTAWITVIAYYFGSSAGSEQKNVLLAQK